MKFGTNIQYTPEQFVCFSFHVGLLVITLWSLGHLVKSPCLSTLLYGYEVWSLSTSDMHKINVVWNNSFRRIFGGFQRESVKRYNFVLFHCLLLLLLTKESCCSGEDVSVYKCNADGYFVLLNTTQGSTVTSYAVQ